MRTIKQRLHYIPNCWHEQIAMTYNLELVDKHADIIILRDPFDRAIEQTMDYLDAKGETNGMTFEELVFKNVNVYCKTLGINEVHVNDLNKKDWKFVHLCSHITWPRITGKLFPKEQVKNHVNFTLETTAQRLSEYLKVEYTPINTNKRFESNELDTALRGDFQVSNSMDYSLLRKIKRKVDIGTYDER